MGNPGWSTTVDLESQLPIDIGLAKPYALADVPFNANHWTRVFVVDDLVVVAKVTQTEVLSRKLELHIEAEEELEESQLNDIVSRIRYECGLDEMLEVIREERKRDILVDIAAKTNPGFRIYANSNIIETACMAILNQNMSPIEFYHLKEMFMAKFGKPVPWDKNLRIFPNKEQLSAITAGEWEELGVGKKVEFLEAMDTKVWREFEIYANYPIYERGLEGMEKIPGVGPYTSRLVMIYGMRRYEKAFYDSFVHEVLDHKYNLSKHMPLSEYDLWVQRRWPRDPALVLHAHIQEYFPESIRALDVEAVRSEYISKFSD